MTDSDSTPEMMDRQRRRERERAAYIVGLRQLADFIEAHPDLPMPMATDQSVYVYGKSDLVAVARIPGVRWQKAPITPASKYFQLRAEFAGGHGYAVFTDRDVMCTKTIIGQRRVAAVPEHDEDEVVWTCDEPLLAAGGEQ